MNVDEYINAFEQKIVENPELATDCLLQAFEAIGPENAFEKEDMQSEEV